MKVAAIIILMCFILGFHNCDPIDSVWDGDRGGQPAVNTDTTGFAAERALILNLLQDVYKVEILEYVQNDSILLITYPVNIRIIDNVVVVSGSEAIINVYPAEIKLYFKPIENEWISSVYFKLDTNQINVYDKYYVSDIDPNLFFNGDANQLISYAEFNSGELIFTFEIYTLEISESDTITRSYVFIGV